MDNGSTDGSPQMVESDYPQVRLIRNSENLGFPKAVNRGIGESTGRYLALVNTDVFVEADSLSKLVAHLEKQPGVAGVGPQLIDRSSHMQYCAGFSPSPASALRQLVGIHAFIGGRSRGVYVRSRFSSKEMNVDWLSGACQVLRKTAIDSVGPMDESHFMYAEDTEYGLRMRDKGWRLQLLPWVRVLHLGGASDKRDDRADPQLLWLSGMFRIAAGRLSRVNYVLFGGLLGAAFYERALMIRCTNFFLRNRLGGVASVREVRAYARTALKLSLRDPKYAAEFCSQLESRRAEGWAKSANNYDESLGG